MSKDSVTYKVFPLEETDPAYSGGLRYFIGIVGGKGRPIPNARVGAYYRLQTAQEVKALIANACLRSVSWEFLESTDVGVEKEIDPCDDPDDDEFEEDHDECLHEVIDSGGKWVVSRYDPDDYLYDWHHEEGDHD